jgi:hypothetical protein
MKGIKVLIILLLFASCSPQKRLNRLLDKHPQLTAKDTVMINDTIITEHISHDTLLNWATLYDTAYIEKERLRIKIVRHNDSIYIKGECLSDTIYRQHKVYVDKIIYKKNKKDGWINRGLFFLLLIFAIAYLLRR